MLWTLLSIYFQTVLLYHTNVAAFSPEVKLTIIVFTLCLIQEKKHFPKIVPTPLEGAL